jgi:RimJ/RimL family protein N-acetyltransferase
MSATTEPPDLRTARLRLRPLRDADAAAMTLLINDLGVARMTTAIPHPYARDMAEDFIALKRHADPAREIVMALDLPEEGFIGALGFHPTGGAYPELGYWLGRPYWGRGLMTEAVNAALDWARTHWRKRAIASGHFADNDASGQVLTKAGFLYTGVIERRHSTARAEAAETRMMVWLA